MKLWMVNLITGLGIVSMCVIFVLYLLGLYVAIFHLISVWMFLLFTYMIVIEIISIKKALKSKK